MFSPLLIVYLVPKFDEILLKLNLGLVRIFNPKSSTINSGYNSL